MVTIPLRNPFETRVLPVLSQPTQAHAAPTRPVIRRLTLALQGSDRLEIWDDRVVAPDRVFALDATFSARVTKDWRAPLTVEPAIGLAMRDERGRWNFYLPSNEEGAWQAAYILRGVCEARGLNLTDLEADDTQAQPWAVSTPAAPTPQYVTAPERHVYDRAYALPQANYTYNPSAWLAPDASAAYQARDRVPNPAAQLSSDTVLLAIAHVSVLFFPVLLPLTIWAALRRSVPWVAAQAREAAGFQAIVAVVGALLLGYATYGALAHGLSAGLRGLFGFAVFMAAATVYAGYGAWRAMGGHDFRYLRLFRRLG